METSMKRISLAFSLAFALLLTTCSLPWKGHATVKLPDQAMPAARREVVAWLRCPRFFTRDSGRGVRRKGAVAQLVRDLAANGGNAFRISVF